MSFKFKNSLVQGKKRKIEDIIKDLDLVPGYPGNQFEEMSSLLVKILKNIEENPTEKKFRKIKTSSSKFFTNIWTVKGGKDFFEYVGFVESGEFVELPIEDQELTKLKEGLSHFQKLIEKKLEEEKLAKEKQARKAEKAKQTREHKEKIEKLKSDPDRINRVINKAIKDEEMFMILIEVYFHENNIEYDDDCLLEKIQPGEKDLETIIKFSTKIGGKLKSGEALMVKVDKEWECKSVKFLE